ncbi:aldehyde dehydrogenase family protein, partial [Bacillus mycoides]|uniref:aldehyde dehydrogenase family protein n=1 Tax=Bacillus mycoides TaxID=1405 RepID=UPI003CC7FB64
MPSPKEPFQTSQPLSFHQRPTYLSKPPHILKQPLTHIPQHLTTQQTKTLPQPIGHTNRPITIFQYYPPQPNHPIPQIIPSPNPNTILYTKPLPLPPLPLITPSNFPIPIPPSKMPPPLIYRNT